MRKIIDYTFIEWADKERFIKKVMNLLNDGYELQGGVIFNGSGLYCQSLVKYSNIPRVQTSEVTLESIKREIDDELRKMHDEKNT